jgi:Kef-type K+ transport system membrane component KefB
MLPFLQLILIILVIIAVAKAGGYISTRLGQPAVVGEVLAGLILGPTALNFLNWPIFTNENLSETIVWMGELGVIMLMFIAGLELHLDDLVKSGKTSLYIGVFGFFLTIGMGFLLASGFKYESPEALFIGLVIAPTSIGISAQTLMELDVLRSKVGTTLLGAAAIDDTLGVLGLTLFTALFLGSAAIDSTSILFILLKMVAYVIVASAFGFWVLPKLALITDKLPVSQGLISFTFVIVLFYAWSAEVLGSMAAILGAFLAGLFLARSSLKDKIETGFSTIAYGIFVPVFFINVGLAANLRQITTQGLLLLAGMIVVVLLSKLLGAGIGGRLGGMSNRESLQLGFGMIPRGEVVLIIAGVGIAEGLIDTNVFSSIVVLVVATTLITPPILQAAFAKPKSEKEEFEAESGS